MRNLEIKRVVLAALGVRFYTDIDAYTAYKCNVIHI